MIRMEIQCVHHGDIAERGRDPALGHRPPHAGQQRAAGDAQPGGDGPGGTGKAAEHFREPALVHHQRARRPRAHPLRRGDHPIRKQFSKKYKAVSADDDET